MWGKLLGWGHEGRPLRRTRHPHALWRWEESTTHVGRGLSRHAEPVARHVCQSAENSPKAGNALVQ